MRSGLLLTALLLYLISAVNMQEDEQDEQAEEQQSLDELLDRQISVSASQCDAEDQCQCTLDAPQPCAYDAEYAELVRARAQLDIVYAHVHGEVVEGIKVDLAALIVRMTSLETSLHNQSISLSMSELAGLQDQVSSMQTTLTQLALSVNSTVTQRLVAEVELIQASLLELGTKNPIAVRADVEKELSALRARVASCSTITSVHQEGALDFIGDGLPYNQTITAGHCPANGNITIGTPVTYKFRNIQATWLKDPLPVSDEEKTKIYETRATAARNQYLFSFNNLNDYESTNLLTKQTQSSCGFNIYGQKPLYINGVFYWYDEYSSSRFIRRMSSLYGKSCPQLASPDRYPDIAFDYNGHAYNDVDLNFDETGLYAVYADSNGDMDIARLNEDTLEREQVWKTGKQKRAVANVFMVCGRLYTIDDYKSRHLSGHQWGYDTKTGEEFTFEMDVESKFGAIQALSYNPREKALFGWDNGHAVLYPVFF